MRGDRNIASDAIKKIIYKRTQKKYNCYEEDK